ncbi:hypothetical protein EDB80DRAFT_825066 [Ilyonectria destructans]|nr:hypothetical protein EDB80DRAFT_825066 [Ilyonectria destructans]
MAYALHQFRVGHNKRCDPAHLQIQTVLRNDVSAFSAIADAFCLFRAWDGMSFRLWKRLIPLLSLAILLLVLPALASVFVSRLATGSEKNIAVLALPEECGLWDFKWSLLNDASRPQGTQRTLSQQLNMIAHDVLDARLYARQFYTDSKPLSVSTSAFSVKKLPYSVRKASCPFAEENGKNRCLSNDVSSNTAMTWDSGKLDSNMHFGLNARPEDCVNVRKILTCSPVKVDDFVNITMKDGLGSAEFQKLLNVNESAIRKYELTRQSTSGYSAWCAYTSGADDYQFAGPFNQTNADVSICFISQNSVGYPSPVYDPLFSANGSTSWEYPNGENLYCGDNLFNTIACLEQVQFCDPRTVKCTSVTHPLAAYFESMALGLNVNQRATLIRIALLMGLVDIGTLGVGSLGAAGLLARDHTYSDVFSAPLPSDQWQREVRLWFETGLALLQAHILRFLGRIDQSSPLMYGYFLTYRPLSELPNGPEREATHRLCYNQKIAMTGSYQNFRVPEVVLVITLSVWIIAVSLVLEPCMKIIRRVWVTREGQLREQSRDMDSKFWLLHKALESVGVEPWRRGGKALNLSIPVANEGLIVEWPTELGVDKFYKLRAGAKDIETRVSGDVYI